MTQTPPPTDPYAADDVWDQLEQGLATYLERLHDVPSTEPDRLVLEILSPHGASALPFATVTTTPDRTRVSATISGTKNAPGHPMHPRTAEWLRDRGWTANEQAGTDWSRQRTLTGDGPIKLAHEVVVALKHGFGVPHPGIYTYRVTGPGADVLPDLGLVAGGDIQPEPAAPETSLAIAPSDPEHLRSMVGQVLADCVPGQFSMDDDGDFVVTLEELGHPVFVWVPPGEPSVRICARVLHDVRSRRATATELAVLNREASFVSYHLGGEREVWARLDLPGSPFVPDHVRHGLASFLTSVAGVRGDLALRTGGRQG